jgi:hypothetical protein
MFLKTIHVGLAVKVAGNICGYPAGTDNIPLGVKTDKKSLA